MRWDLLRLFIAFWIVVGVGGWAVSKVIGWGIDMLERWRR